MIKEITLVASHGRLANKEPFFIAGEEKLILKLNGYIKSDSFIVSLRNGNASATIKTGAKFEVPAKVLRGGTLEIVVSLYGGGKLTKSWNIEPITIVEHNDGFEGFSTIIELTKAVAALAENVEQCRALASIWKTVQKECQKSYALAEACAESVRKLIEISKGE